MTIKLKTAIVVVVVLFVAVGPVSAFRVASYNVENLFDLKHDGSEYKEFVPGNRYRWDRKMLDIKVRNLARVIGEMKADVVALQEVESREAVEYLVAELGKKGASYPWVAIADLRKRAVTCAVISKFRIVHESEIRVAGGRMRSILKVTVDVSGRPLTLFVNHWRSRKGPESLRVESARALKKALGKMKWGDDYILAGDFNSSHDEYEKIKVEKKMNDTGGITGINHVLGTIADGRAVTERILKRGGKPGIHYNLWFEVPEKERWSHNFFGRKRSLDSMILPAALYDGEGVFYVDNSFKRFAPDYLFLGKAINRWQRARKGRGKHLGVGFSDHLPVYADFGVASGRALF